MPFPRQPGPRVNSHYRGNHPIERLQVRIFALHNVHISTESWNSRNICNSYWRFYCNEADGASLAVHSLDGTIYPFPLMAGAVYLIPAGVRFDCLCDHPRLPHFYIHFDAVGMPGILLRKLFAKPIRISDDNHIQSQVHALKSVAGESVERPAIDELGAFCRSKALLFEALAIAIAEITAEEKEQCFARASFLEPIFPALELMETRFAEPLPNPLLAKVCCYSEDYFIRRFKESVGESPGQYLLQRRIEIGANRLLFSDDSIEQVALSCGFGNRFYFTRVFTRQMGVSPAAYRKISRV